MNAEEDTIELTECLAARIGQGTKSSIDDAFAKIITEAEKNVISKSVPKKLHKCWTNSETCFGLSQAWTLQSMFHLY